MCFHLSNFHNSWEQIFLDIKVEGFEMFFSIGIPVYIVNFQNKKKVNTSQYSQIQNVINETNRRTIISSKISFVHFVVSSRWSVGDTARLLNIFQIIISLYCNSCFTITRSFSYYYSVKKHPRHANHYTGFV